ncbi:MAG: hypothetical protein M1820_001629 [Bogoriella megaspora]|nr:MAG: hypothetical protein M1820_001629 [Bogoriella megaspora]
MALIGLLYFFLAFQALSVFANQQYVVNNIRIDGSQPLVQVEIARPALSTYPMTIVAGPSADYVLYLLDNNSLLSKAQKETAKSIVSASEVTVQYPSHLCRVTTNVTVAMNTTSCVGRSGQGLSGTAESGVGPVQGQSITLVSKAAHNSRSLGTLKKWSLRVLKGQVPLRYLIRREL